MQAVTTQGPRRILVIDDNDAIHNDFRKILAPEAPAGKLAAAKAMLFGDAGTSAASPAVAAGKASGKVRFEVDSALQGQEGLRKLTEGQRAGKPYSVAFVDMRMPPGWDGLETIQRLWQVDRDLQVVICSAYSDYSWDEISEKLGLTDQLLILKKPFDPQEVVQLAAALSEKWELRRRERQHVDHLEELVKARTAELTQLALHDKLTGLPNRASFNDRLAKAVERAQLDPNYAYAVLFLDFDGFKLINDSLGHEAGDRVLKGIADRLTGAMELAGSAVGDALAARLGGDEFTLFIDGPAAARDGAAPRLDVDTIAERLLHLLGSPHQLDERAVYCTASIGYTTSEVGYTRAEHVVRDADTAMYSAKSLGKNRCVKFDHVMHDAVARRLRLENDLRQSLEHEDFTLLYQPIVSLSTGKTAGVEALVRWNHPTRGLVPPGEFIPCCEEIGLIRSLGLWVVRAACRQLRQWQLRDPAFANLTMSVNVSARQLADPEFAREIATILDQTGVSPRSLALEITETAMMTEPAVALAVMKQLRALGVGLHLDDFGTGYSSLSSLHQYPLTAVKIDRSFVKNSSERRDHMAVVSAIINLARHLGMELVAEGIESADQIVLLQAMDCELAQGYYFQKPTDAAGIEQYLGRKVVPALAA